MFLINQIFIKSMGIGINFIIDSIGRVKIDQKWLTNGNEAKEDQMNFRITTDHTSDTIEAETTTDDVSHCLQRYFDEIYERFLANFSGNSRDNQRSGDSAFGYTRNKDDRGYNRPGPRHRYNDDQNWQNDRMDRPKYPARHDEMK